MRGLLSLCLCVTALWLAGCAGYQLGPTGGQKAGARSVQIDPILNRTLEPRLSEYVINSIRKNIQQDGTYILDTHGEGDVILSGAIVSYRRSDLSYVPTDVTTVLDYQIYIAVKVTARERSTGRVLFDKTVSGQTTLRAGNDLTSVERQSIPLAADEIGKKATALLVDGSW